MDNSVNLAVNFVEKLKTLNYLVVLIGNGASMEGTTKDNKPYPDFSNLVFSVLSSAGYNSNGKITVENAINAYFSTFVDYLKEEQSDNSKYLNEFFDGNTSATHNHFASLMSALSSHEKNDDTKLIFVTTNYDNFIEQSFKNIGIESFSKSLPRNKEKITVEFFTEILEKIEKNIPVVLHIFGDLNKESPIFYQKDMKFSKLENEFLSEIFKKDMIVIGYSFSDDNIKDLVCKQNKDTHKSLFYISSKNCDNKKESENPRIIHNAQLRFNAFVTKILTELYKKTYEQPISEKLVEIKNNYELKIKKLDEKFSYDAKFLQWRVDLVNNYSNKRVLLKTENDSVIDRMAELYVEREIVKWNEFLQGDKSIAAIKGNAGVGKSTYLYIQSTSSSNDVLKLLINSSILENYTLREYLSNQFLCSPDKIEYLFDHFDNILKNDNKYFVILIDAINELSFEKAKRLRVEIEDIFKRKWEYVKIIYSCRNYFWKTVFSDYDYSDDNNQIYEIDKFNDEQLVTAFYKYKKVFNLHGELNNLTDDFKNRLKDPLMLRLLAEGYEGKGIPAFAPAVKIFEQYLELLKKRCTDEIEEVLIEIGNIYWDASSSDIVGTMSLHKIFFKDINKVHLKSLKDADIIDEKDDYIQFNYERFFEFILGYSLVYNKGWRNRANKITSTDVFDIWKQCIDDNKPYTFTFALKSSLIYLSISERFIDSSYNNKKLLENSILLKELIGESKIPHKEVNNDEKNQLKDFTLETLRELLSEIEVSITESSYEKLKLCLGNELFNEIILDIGNDDPKSIPYQVELLSDNNPKTRQKIVFNILYLCNNVQNLDILVNSIYQYQFIDKNCYKGIIYLLPVFIKHYELLNSSPFIYVGKIVKKILMNLPFNRRASFIHNILEAAKDIYIEEGELFFGGKSQYNGITYNWEMKKKEKEMAYILADLFSRDRIIGKLRKSDKDSLCFFISGLRRYSDMNIKADEFLKIGRMRSWGYFMSRYTIVKIANNDFNMALNLLDDFMKDNPWLMLDFALTSMENILRTIYLHDDEKYNIGLERMKKWVSIVENDFPEFFYHRLSEKSPLDAVLNPLSPTANTIVDKINSDSFIFLDDYIKSKDIKKAKLAILSLRKTTGRFPKAGKNSLILAWNMKSSYDEEYSVWLDLFISEIMLIHPKMAYDFFEEVNATQEVRNRIKSIKDASPKTNEYNMNPLFLWLVNDEISRHKVMEIYKDMIYSDSIDIFFQDILRNHLRDFL